MAEDKKWRNVEASWQHLLIIGVVVSGLLGLTMLLPEPDEGGKSAANSEHAAVPDYTISVTEDLSFGATTRYQYRVVVPGDPTEDELRAVVDDVIEGAKDGPKFNAVSVGLFASESEVDGVYTLGYAELAPGGDWNAADTVSAGDYGAMELVVEIY